MWVSVGNQGDCCGGLGWNYHSLQSGQCHQGQDRQQLPYNLVKDSHWFSGSHAAHLNFTLRYKENSSVFLN